METKKQNYTLPIIVMIFLFGMISFVTNLASPMGDILKYQFNVPNWMGTLGVFANFIAYAIMGYPAGNMLQKYGYKKTALVAIAVGFTGVGIQTLSGSVESFGVYLLAEARHGVECAPGVAVVEIVRADVSQLVAHAHKFLGPSTVVNGEAFAEHFAPVQVKQDKAALDVQRVDKLLFRAVFGEVALLLIPEFAHDRNTPPVCPVLNFE